MKWAWLLVLLLCQQVMAAAPCSGGVTAGTLSLSCNSTRANGISPLLVFFDCTATTDSGMRGANNVFQDVYFQWTFGDPNASGTTTWAYGSNPNGNSRNAASGAVAAHLYITSQDTAYTAQVWAYDGTYEATCQIPVTAYNPTGANGFTTKTCYYNSTPGTGCPTGATQTASSTTHAPAAGQLILYKCGDTFTGGTTVPAVAKWSIGAYGACANTQITNANQATFPKVTGTININTTASDGRVSDLVCNTGAVACVLENNAYDPPYTATTQITLNNLWSNATNTSFYVAQATQQGYIQLVANSMGSQQQDFINYAQNNCVGGTHTYPCPSGLVPVQYTAMLGGHYDGTGATTSSSGIETVRVDACRMCVFSNNDMGNANNTGAVFKLHNGQYKNTQCQFLGQQTEYLEVSDNYFYGEAGGQTVEIVAQNNVTDERIQNVIFERNLLAGTTATSGRQLLLGAMNTTVRNNVFNGTGVGNLQGIQMARRGFEYTSNNTNGNSCAGTGTTAAPINANFPQYAEIYNNTFYNGTAAVSFSSGNGLNGTGPGNNSFAQNNLIYLASAITNSGSGNTVNSNSPNTTSNPGFSNAGGSFRLMTDFHPTANFSGATALVPNFFDVCGFAWAGGYTLGPVSQVCPPQPPVIVGLTADSTIVTADSTTHTADGK